MKKAIRLLKQKKIGELEKEVDKQRELISQMMLEQKVKAPKDTNELSKARKKLAQMLTVLQEKKIEQRVINELKTK